MKKVLRIFINLSHYYFAYWLFSAFGMDKATSDKDLAKEC